MINILDEIVEKTKIKIAEKKQGLSLEELRSKLDFENLKASNFKKSIQDKTESVIAEIKKASPSAGIISENFDPILKAKEYESFGASALSILTEEDYFQGDIEHLKDVKALTSLPILRKDFIIDEYQLYESKLIGADCILLIASILNDKEIEAFSKLSDDLCLDYIIEVHDEEELSRVECFSKAIIGVNNRDLKTFEVDINNSINLKKVFKGDNIFVAESGIKSQKDIKHLREHNINVFLIGESLMNGDFFEA